MEIKKNGEEVLKSNISNDIVLSDNEKQIIEVQRKEIKNLDDFKNSYNELVQRTGFTWVVDVNSTLQNPQLGISRHRN